MIAVLFGAPGSGKGTQAQILVSRLGFLHISTGELLRAEIEKGTPLGEQVAPILRAGDLVPDELMIKLIENRLRGPGANHVLLDGFPRTVAQAEALLTMLRGLGREVGLVLVLDVPDEELRRRSLERSRDDDNPETFTRRMEEYHAKTKPVLDFLAGRAIRIVKVNGFAPIQTVTAEITRHLEGNGVGTA